MLRESGQQTGDDYDLGAVNGGRGDGGVIAGAALVAFAEAVVAGVAGDIQSARRAVIQALGPAAMVDAAAVIAQFNAIDRVADATGTPLEPAKAEATADFRPGLGINDFPSAEGKI